MADISGTPCTVDSGLIRQYLIQVKLWLKSLKFINLYYNILFYVLTISGLMQSLNARGGKLLKVSQNPNNG